MFVRFEHGVFDRSHADNPFATYNQVRIPYCSGDTHAGHTELSVETSEGVERWEQHGFDNVVATLDHIANTISATTTSAVILAKRSRYLRPFSGKSSVTSDMRT